MKIKNLPDAPGVYYFLGAREKVLYIGKATSLRDRVRSYFRDDLLHARGKHILDMVALATDMTWKTTDSVLEALILEAAEIKKHQPPYNTNDKDDKSWNYVVVTDEEFPVVRTERSRALHNSGQDRKRYRYVFGPFTSGAALGEALRVVRRIFPFRDEKCKIPPKQKAGKGGYGRPCFQRQIGLCPGVCTGEISAKEYARTINHIRLFFEGRKRELVRGITSEMRAAAKGLAFERAAELKRELFALGHIKDVTLIGKDIKEVSQRVAASRRTPFRIEAYDIAHILGRHTVGVMTVIEDGIAKKSDYRKFRIRGEGSDRAHDVMNLEEVLRRRFGHPEWPRPDLVVMDGGVAQKRAGERILREFGLSVPVVAVVKDERHKPKGIMGRREFSEAHKAAILLVNAESHRFAVAYHRKLRERLR